MLSPSNSRSTMIKVVVEHEIGFHLLSNRKKKSIMRVLITYDQYWGFYGGFGGLLARKFLVCNWKFRGGKNCSNVQSPNGRRTKISFWRTIWSNWRWFRCHSKSCSKIRWATKATPRINLKNHAFKSSWRGKYSIFCSRSIWPIPQRVLKLMLTRW